MRTELEENRGGWFSFRDPSLTRMHCCSGGPTVASGTDTPRADGHGRTGARARHGHTTGTHRQMGTQAHGHAGSPWAPLEHITGTFQADGCCVRLCFKASSGTI